MKGSSTMRSLWLVAVLVLLTAGCAVMDEDTRLEFERACELVETGRLRAEDFRRFAFEAPSRFYLQTNPRFLEGTILESEAGALLSVTK